MLARRLTALVTTRSAIATTADHLDIDPPEGNNGRSLQADLCRQEGNFRGVCLNGTHPSLLAVASAFRIVDVSVASGIEWGQWTESTIVCGRFDSRKYNGDELFAL